MMAREVPNCLYTNRACSEQWRAWRSWQRNQRMYDCSKFVDKPRWLAAGNFLERECGLRLRNSCKRVSHHGLFLWTDMYWKIFNIFNSDLDLKMNWSEVAEKSVVVVCLWARRNLTYSRGWRFVLHTSTPSFLFHTLFLQSRCLRLFESFLESQGALAALLYPSCWRRSKYPESWNPSKNAPDDFRNRTCTQKEDNYGFWTEKAKKTSATMMYILWIVGGPPIKPKRVFLPLWMSERFEGLLKGEGWPLTPARYPVWHCIVHSPVIGPFKMMQSTSSVLRKRSIASRGLGRSFKFVNNDEAILT